MRKNNHLIPRLSAAPQVFQAPAEKSPDPGMLDPMLRLTAGMGHGQHMQDILPDDIRQAGNPCKFTRR
jgi:hypothetical protein